jgi:hypothetical protein
MKVDVGDGLAVEITLNRNGQPPGKLADAVLFFEDGPLVGLCLLGLGVWERREKPSEINVTMPARQFVSKGEKRSFNLVRIDHDLDEAKESKQEYYAPLDSLRRRVVKAYTTAVSTPVDDAPVDDAPEDDLGW